MKNDRTVKQQAKLFEGRDHWHLNSEKMSLSVMVQMDCVLKMKKA